MRPFEACPNCDQYFRVSLRLGWQDEFEQDPTTGAVWGPRIPQIGCGNPWHYLESNVESHNGVTLYNSLQEADRDEV